MTPTDDRAISYLRVPDEEDWPAEISELAESFQSKIGFVPNIFRSFALLPDHFLGWWRYFDDLMGGSGSGLTKAQREMIAVVVSTENRCHYCMLSHGAACRFRTRDPVLVDELLTNYHRADLPAPERAMLDFAVKVANRAHELTGADIETMRNEGWGDEEILHVIEIASMFSFTGRLANAIGLLANPEYADLGRHARPK
jgi:uncharacterized peroxidase-related enzyme